MKILLAGAFGKLGIKILDRLIADKHEVIAVDQLEKLVPDYFSSVLMAPIDVTIPDSLNGICKDIDIVISTIAKTESKPNVSCYDVDYRGNMNLLNEALSAGVKKFIYVSSFDCDNPEAEDLAPLHAKMLFEKELLRNPVDSIIYRPSGFFHSVKDMFEPFLEKGEVVLTKEGKDKKVNCIAAEDFADFLAEHLEDSDKLYNIGGTETYSYGELSELVFKSFDKKLKIKTVPAFFYTIDANKPSTQKDGKYDEIMYRKWILSHDRVSDTVTGERSLAEYIENGFNVNELL